MVTILRLLWTVVGFALLVRYRTMTMIDHGSPTSNATRAVESTLPGAVPGDGLFHSRVVVSPDGQAWVYCEQRGTIVMTSLWVLGSMLMFTSQVRQARRRCARRVGRTGVGQAGPVGWAGGRGEAGWRWARRYARASSWRSLERVFCCDVHGRSSSSQSGASAAAAKGSR